MSTHCRRDTYAPGGRSTPARAVLVLLGVACGSLSVSPIAVAFAQQREMMLSLREATAFALQGNLELQIAGITPRIRQAEVTERQGIFDVTARAQLRASDNRLLETATGALDRVGGPFRPGDLDRIGQDNSQEQRLGLGITQLTPYGGTYEVEVTESHLSTTRRTTVTDAKQDAVRARENDPSAAPVPPFRPRSDLYAEEVALRVSQPLLRNFGIGITTNQISIAQNNLTSSREDLRRQVMVVTSRVQQAYWDLVFRRQDLDVRRQQQALAQRLLDQIRKQVAVGTLAPLEALQAETNIARAEERILVAANAMRATEDRLKRVMNFGLMGDLADVILLPVDGPTYVAPTLDLDEYIRQALELRPDLIQAKLALENQNITLVFNKNQVLPVLDVEATFRFNGIDSRLGDSFAEIDPTTRYRWEVGLNFRYPLQNRQAKGRLEQTRLNIRQQMVRIQNLEEEITFEVRNAVRDVLTNSQRVQVTRVATRLAQRQLEAEEKKLQVGLATVFTVLQFQDVLGVERSNEINAVTEFLKALVRLEEAKSTLLQSYNIVLQPDGPRLQ